MSVPFFYEPNMEAVIKPIIKDTNVAKAKEMMDYIEKTFGKTYITPADLFFERLAQRNNRNFDP